jgi:hypothetical protein
VTSVIASGQLWAALPLALLAGLVSFASPCVLPLPGVPRGGGLSGPRRRDRDGVSHRAMVSENDQELTQKDDTARWLLTSLPSSSCSGN